jgi:hypothetical protein
MFSLIATAPGLIKRAGKFGDLRRAFHAAGMADRAHGTMSHAQRLAKRWTPMAETTSGSFRPTQSTAQARSAAEPSMAQAKRVKYTDQAQAARTDWMGRKSQRDESLDSVFGKPSTWLGRTGRSAFNQTAGLVYDLPRALAFSPASKTGLTGAIGVGVGANMLGVPDPYSYSLPDVVGKGFYTGSGRAMNDARNYAQAGAEQGVGDMMQGYQNMPFSQRWQIARDPSKTGIQGNSFSQAPKQQNNWSIAGSLLRNAGGIGEDVIRNQVANGVNQQANQFLHKQAGWQDWGKNLSRFMRPVTQPARRTYNKIPMGVKAGLGTAATIGIPSAFAYGAYTGEQDKVRGTAYDQGYDSGQYNAQQAYQNMPVWQRALAAVAPGKAMEYGMSQMGPKPAPAAPQPGFNDMDGKGGFNGPVTTMYTRPDGTDVY